MPVQTVHGDYVKVVPQYQRLTLVQAYLQFCRQHGHVAVVPTTFTALIMKACLERGWPVRENKAGDTRRVIVQGISIKGQTPFHGTDDRFIEGHIDRRRWQKKSGKNSAGKSG